MMTIKDIEQTCKNDGWTITIEKREKDTYVLLKKTFVGQTPPLYITLHGKTNKEIIENLKRITDEFDIDKETYRHLNPDGHGFGGYPLHVTDVCRAVRFHKDEMNRLLIDCSDTLLPAQTNMIPGYEFRRRTKEMLKRCFNSTDRLIDRIISESNIDMRDTPNANLLTVSATKAVLRWMADNFKPGFNIPYNRHLEIQNNEKKIYSSLR